MQGHELEAQVQESKLYSDRLAALEADLEEARLAEREARDRHAKHMAEMEPLASKHRHHKVVSKDHVLRVHPMFPDFAVSLHCCISLEF